MRNVNVAALLCALLMFEVAAHGQVGPVPESLKVDPFYQKYVSANGFPILSSGKVSDFALLEAAYLVNLMLAKRPDVRDAMIQSGTRMVVIGHTEFTTDIPEHREFKPKDFWDRRARGTGGSLTDPVCTCAEENVLAYPGDPYSTECILIHEFAHAIHIRGMARVDPTFDRRLKEAYDAAMKNELWKEKYAATNHHEYFAEGVQSWFDNNRPPDHDHNHVRTRVQLKEYDPGLAAMCEEVFGDTELKYSKPTTRLTGHLADYDPGSAPTFRWPPHLAQLGEKIRQEAVEKRRANASPRSMDGYIEENVEGWTVHIRSKLLADQAEATERAKTILRDQLKVIATTLPSDKVEELRKVHLWMSPEYPGVGPTAEYHPDAGWLKSHKRDPAMAKGVEFTNVRIFDKELQRMPVFVLHELAHAYHDRVLGFENSEVEKVYQAARASGTYDNVERWSGPDRPKVKEKAYGMSNAKEYFAESTEAFFGRNDFYPFDRAELQRHDPMMYELLMRLWGVKE